MDGTPDNKGESILCVSKLHDQGVALYNVDQNMALLGALPQVRRTAGGTWRRETAQCATLDACVLCGGRGGGRGRSAVRRGQCRMHVDGLFVVLWCFADACHGREEEGSSHRFAAG